MLIHKDYYDKTIIRYQRDIMITRIVSRCDNCGYENRFPMDSDDSDSAARSDIEHGNMEGGALLRMCEDVSDSKKTVEEIVDLISNGWILRDVAQICVICPVCSHFGARIWYSTEYRNDGKRSFRNNDIKCDCGAIMERFDPIAENKRKAVYRCVKCGADNQLDRRFKLKDFD